MHLIFAFSMLVWLEHKSHKNSLCFK